MASIFVTGFWMAMIINMVNFIDGLDGLAAGVCGISALTFAIISLATNFPAMGVLAAVLAGATFAFLRFNFHPATIFMGDAGSMLLGFVLACISVQSVMKGTAAIALVLPLLVLGVPFVDLFLIVWRRWRRGVPFYSPGQDHVHHDLVLVHGFSQRKSVLLLYSWCACLSALAIACSSASGRRSSCSASPPPCPPSTWRGCSAATGRAAAACPIRSLPEWGTIRRGGADGDAHGPA